MLTISTLAWADTDLRRALVFCAENNIAGLDIRVHEHGEVEPGADAKRLREIRRMADSEGVVLSSLLGYHVFSDGRGGGDMLRELDELGRISELLGVKKVRIFGAAGRYMQSPCERLRVVDELKNCLERVCRNYADTTFMLQNHRLYLELWQALSVLDDLALSNAGLVFSPDHCFVTGEDVAGSMEGVERHIRQFYLADVCAGADGEFRHVIPGAGAVGLDKYLARFCGKDLTLTLKWERKWHDYLPPLEDALPEFLRLCRAFSGR